MSIIIGFISKHNGVVASDGREFDAVSIQNGVGIEQANVKSQELDKTFSLDEGKLIGAFCGLTSFSGAIVSEHISQILYMKILPNHCFYEQLAFHYDDQLGS